MLTHQASHKSEMPQMIRREKPFVPILGQLRETHHTNACIANHNIQSPFQLQKLVCRLLRSLDRR